MEMLYSLPEQTAVLFKNSLYANHLESTNIDELAQNLNLSKHTIALLLMGNKDTLLKLNLKTISIEQIAAAFGFYPELSFVNKSTKVSSSPVIQDTPIAISTLKGVIQELKQEIQDKDRYIKGLKETVDRRGKKISKLIITLKDLQKNSLSRTELAKIKLQIRQDILNETKNTTDKKPLLDQLNIGGIDENERRADNTNPNQNTATDKDTPQRSSTRDRGTETIQGDTQLLKNERGTNNTNLNQNTATNNAVSQSKNTRDREIGEIQEDTQQLLDILDSLL